MAGARMKKTENESYPLRRCCPSRHIKPHQAEAKSYTDEGAKSLNRLC